MDVMYRKASIYIVAVLATLVCLVAYFGHQTLSLENELSEGERAAEMKAYELRTQYSGVLS